MNLMHRFLEFLRRVGLAFMAKPSATGIELAPTVYTGTAVATGASAAVILFGAFNLFIYGTFVGTIQLERSFDGGTTWIAAALDGVGTIASYAVPSGVVFNEPEPGMLYRLNCTAYTSGTISWRISGGSRLT